MALYGAGDSIAGEKIYWRFGGYTTPSSKAGKKVGSFSLRGYARVQQPLKRATKIAPRERETIECVSAAYSATDFRAEKQKVPCKSHTCFEGFLTGDASCRIKIPHPQPPK